MGGRNSTRNTKQEKIKLSSKLCFRRLYTKKNIKLIQSSIENIILCDGVEQSTDVGQDQFQNGSRGITSDKENKRQERKTSSMTVWPVQCSCSLFLPHYKIKKQEIDNYYIEKMVGKGAYSEVFKVISKRNDEVIALKQLGKSHLILNQMIQQVQDEITILEKLKHEHIINLISSWQDKCYLYQVFPFVDYGDLFSLWKRVKIFSLSSIAEMSLEVASTLGYIHSQRVIYRDLKMENILITETGHILLSDFGLSVMLNEHQTHVFTICGTLKYLAPEVASGNGYSFSCDWWSFGVILVTMATGKFPFSIMSSHREMYLQIKENLIYLQRSNHNEAVKEIIVKMLCFKADDRLSSLNDFQTLKLLNAISTKDDVINKGPLYVYCHENE